MMPTCSRCLKPYIDSLGGVLAHAAECAPTPIATAAIREVENFVHPELTTPDRYDSVGGMDKIKCCGPDCTAAIDATTIPDAVNIGWTVKPPEAACPVHRNHHRLQPLKVEIIDGRLVASIGVDTLAGAVRENPDFEVCTGAPSYAEFLKPKITDQEKLAAGIARLLASVETEGAGHSFAGLIDRAAAAFIESGDDGVLEPGDPDYDAAQEG
jgi:hypothetical protein